MEPFVKALCQPQAYPHPTGAIEVVETHISWVFLTELWAYKVKKPLELGFLDFSTLEKRLSCCNAELCLNRRLCPDLYMAVVPVVWNGAILRFDAPGDIVDYAVKMVRFDRTMELDRMLSQKLLREEHIDLLASVIAEFHTSLTPLPVESGFGQPENLIKPMLHNFTSLESIISGKNELSKIMGLKSFTLQEHRRLNPLLIQRKQKGCIRSCHGDMHTGNMVWWKNRIFIFDCIEFNENLSNIDVISDLAFLFMDLEHGGEPKLAWRLLNNYLTETGDYNAVPLLRFYALYRAMVRAKVTAIRHKQSLDATEALLLLEEHRSYISRAMEYSLPTRPMLIMTNGISGSGKTFASRDIAQTLGCIHIRSDIERKRLLGLKPLERSSKNESLYSKEISNQTYVRLLELAASCLKGKISVIVDATFLQACYRNMFWKLADKLKVPCRILQFSAPKEQLLERVSKRYKSDTDASDADGWVITMQLGQQEKLSVEESLVTIRIDSSIPVDAAAVSLLLQSVSK